MRFFSLKLHFFWKHKNCKLKCEQFIFSSQKVYDNSVSSIDELEDRRLKITGSAYTLKLAKFLVNGSAGSIANKHRQIFP